MKKRIFLIFFLLLACGFGLLAQSEADPVKDEVATINVTYVSPRKVKLAPGSIQKIDFGKENLVIAYERMHKTGNFPVIRIQDIPFKLSSAGQKIEFTWNQAGYEVYWQGTDDTVVLKSSENFANRAFSLENKDVNAIMIYSGLVVQTKRRNGVISKLEIVDIMTDGSGRMEKFSVRTYANESDMEDYHNENNILAPEFHKQYEKGVNDEVLYIFTTNENGEIFIYYR